MSSRTGGWLANDCFGEGYRTPALCDGWACAGAGVRKELGGPVGERAYGDFWAADCGRARRRRPAALSVFAGSGGVRCFRWRQCARANSHIGSNCLRHGSAEPSGHHPAPPRLMPLSLYRVVRASGGGRKGGARALTSLHLDAKDQDIHSRFRCSGSIKTSQEIFRLCRGNSRLMLAAALSFVGPCCKPFGSVLLVSRQLEGTAAGRPFSASSPVRPTAAFPAAVSVLAPLGTGPPTGSRSMAPRITTR